MNESTNKAPTIFWIVSTVALLWNLMGCFQFFAEYSFWKNPESRDVLPEAMRGLYELMPPWLYIVFALAVLSGVLGCIGLLMRKSWCIALFYISLIAVLVQNVYLYLMTDIMKALGPSTYIMPSVVILFAIFLLYYSKSAKSKGWIP